ncbi:zinc finger and BTB domain-containing protein 17-like [Anopheles aquasalis]|uniref:zinc finger and BTB domain-containing protein 17-like n=1 Tax=Anopheles aquasalis TaxID=42839 RepID=UPI00215AFC43|nr:zinc finger and BTB domain-containing protein 17-like [Anopheles aquasalis]
MDNMCRLCLERIVRKKATSIGNHQFQSMVRRVFPFEIDYDTRLPMKVCGKCFSIVREFHWYSQKVQAVQELLERQLYTTENASSCPVAEVAIRDDDAGEAKEQIGFTACDLNTRADSFSDTESVGSKDTQRTVQEDATPANHIDSEHCRTDCSNSNDPQNNIDEVVEGEEIVSMQSDEMPNDNPESSTASVHELRNESLHTVVDQQPATVTTHDKGTEPLSYNTTEATEYEQSSETINDYFPGLSEIVISDSAGWFEDVQNIICEEVPLLEEFEIFTKCSFADANESAGQEAESNEPSEPQDQPPTVASHPCAAVTFQVAGPKEPAQGMVANHKEDSNPNETEEMDYGYEEKSDATKGVSIKDLNPSDSPTIADTEHQTDSPMKNTHGEIDYSPELHKATESIASSMSSQDDSAAGAYIGEHQPAYLAGPEGINGHFENQNDCFNDEHNQSNLIDHVQEVPYEEIVYSEEAEDQSDTITDHVQEGSPEREMDKMPIVAENVSPCHSNAQPVVPSSSSGFMDAFSKFVKEQNPPVKPYNRGKSKLELYRRAAVASISNNQQQNLPTRISKHTKRRQKASNELDNAIEKYFDLRCELCPFDAEESFNTFDSLTEHFRKVHETRGYARCCGKQYFYRSQLMEHIDYHRGLLRCSVCDRNFTTRATMKQHESVYHRTTDVLYPCPECTNVFDNPNELLMHQSLVHKRVSREMQKSQGQRTMERETCGGENDATKPDNTLPCLHCSKVFRSENRLNSHILLYHARKPFACEFCSFLFPNMPLLRAHKRTVHSVKGTSSDSRTTMPQSEPRIAGIVNDDGKAAPKKTHLCKTAICTVNSDKAKSDDNKAKVVSSASEAYSTR